VLANNIHQQYYKSYFVNKTIMILKLTKTDIIYVVLFVCCCVVCFMSSTSHFNNWSNVCHIYSQVCSMPWIMGHLVTKLYDKRNYFNFPIVNFPFICSNIPVAPAYGIYIFQLAYGFLLPLSYIKTLHTPKDWE